MLKPNRYNKNKRCKKKLDTFKLIDMVRFKVQGRTNVALSGQQRATYLNVKGNNKDANNLK